MRRVLLIGTLGALLSVTGAEAGSKCGTERETLRMASAAVRGDESALGRLHEQAVRLSRAETHARNAAYHFQNAVLMHRDEQGKAQYFVDQYCQGAAQHGGACEAHRDRVAWITVQIDRLEHAEEVVDEVADARHAELVAAQARVPVVQAQLAADSATLQDAKDALASCLAG